MCMFFGNGFLESSSENLLVGYSQLAGLVLKYWASPEYMLYWQLRSLLRQSRFEVACLWAFFPTMVSFVCVPQREIVGWLVSVGKDSLSILSFALTRAQLKTVMNYETNWFWISWLLRMFSKKVPWSLRARSCWLVVFFWPCYSRNTELRMERCFFDSWDLLRDNFPFELLVFEYVFRWRCMCMFFGNGSLESSRGNLVGWLFSVGRITVEILSFALIYALLTAEISCETNSFRSSWFIRFCSDSGLIRSRFRARNCWLAVFSWPG